LVRVIQIDSISKERNRLIRSIVIALRELVRQTETNDQTYDLAAYIVLALKDISRTIDISVSAWEKRDYWLKADRFRMQWAWTDKLSQDMHTALREGNWEDVASLSAQVAGHFNGIRTPQRKKVGNPWEGAWSRLNSH
jgi:hypothetical protein